MHATSPIHSRDTRLSFLWLEITEKCNLACGHCYADSSPHRSLEGEMALEDWLSVLDEAAELGVAGIQFIGGEPTLHPHFETLLRRASELRLDDLEVYTNATRLSEATIALLAQCGAKVATSFYAADADVHDRVTTRLGSWGRTVSGIEKVLAADIPLRVGIIETRENSGHVAAASQFLQDLGVRQIGVDRERAVGRGAVAALAGGEDFSQLCGQCWKGRACVTANGNIYPCVFSRKSLIGHVRAGLRSATESRELARFTATLQAEEAQRTVSAQCYPELPCSPQVCQPQMPCSPQGPFCSPDQMCMPQNPIRAKREREQPAG